MTTNIIERLFRFYGRLWLVLLNKAIVLRKDEYPDVRFHWSQCAEDVVIESILGTHSKGFYVDVGAHHPTSLSNTMALYKLGWSGINIDPNPTLFQAFNNSRKRDVNLNVGISSNTGSLDYYMFECSLLNTLDKDKADVWTKHSKLVDVRQVPCTTLELVLREYLPLDVAIDLLSVDVEGHELSVLKSNDWTAHRPRLVVVEQLHRLPLLDIPTSELYTFMRLQRYDCVGIVGHSHFYLRCDLMDDYCARELA
jgi:FkbM family methyltransferase